MYSKLLNIFKNRKGFTFVEIMICVTVLGILTAVAVPVFTFSLNKHRTKECSAQKIMITTTVESAMTGQIDNGATQYFIPTLANISSGSHYKVRFNDAGDIMNQKEEEHTDSNNDGICEVCGFRTEYQHIDKDSNNKCDLCKKTLKYTYNNNDHITSSEVKITETQAGNVIDLALYGKYEELEEQRVLEDEFGEPILNEGGEIQYIYETDENGNYVLDAEGNKIVLMQTNHYCYTVIKNYNFFLKLNENLTLGDIRGNYRPETMQSKTYVGLEDYKEGCGYDYFCKKKALKDVPFYTYFANQEMPHCPFDEDGTKGYFYYIDAMGKCHCSHCG